MQEQEQNPDNRKPSRAMVAKLMEVSGLRDTMSTYIKSALKSASELFLKNIDETKRDDIVGKLARDEEYVEEFSKIYAEYLTVSEVLDLIAFHKSPTGQKMISIQEPLGKRLVDTTQELMSNMYIKIMAKAMQTNFKIFNDQIKELGLDDILEEEK